MSKLAFIYLILFGLLTPGFTQKRNIIGRILSNDEQRPIKNANIIIVGSETVTTSNHLGFFALEVGEDDIGSLIISHIGYATSKVEIPEIDNFKIILDREYIYIAEFDLGHFKEREPDLSGEPTDSLATKNEMNAKYPGGWEHFFNDLGRTLHYNSVWDELPGDSVLKVSFTVDQLGRMSEFIFDPYLNHLDSIETQLKSLKKWSPALQNGNPTNQFYKLSLKWSESPAIPVGGMHAFYYFVGDNLRYPKKSRNAGVQGRVFVEFRVDVDGSIIDIKILRGVSADIDEEAMRIISLSPKWIPGSKGGRPVKQRIILPITFKVG